ncbi:MAG: exodeoxyribonuclease I [Succinivibrionaceae bacterium]|nr:exodeoxyribonuclease I [Succinivibrionaceae bacterium]
MSDPIETFTFYDLETFGRDPKQDRIVQFAGVRTDANLNVIEQLVIYCKPQRDYLPSIEAITITGITPSFADRNGLSENAFIEQVLQFLSRTNNCVLGFNSIKFDDEFIRHTAFRNFYPPYAYNSMCGSSRWDIYPLVRLCCALCPEGINWPYDEKEGRYVLKLAELTRANGLEHAHAHDALSDVLATIEVMKLIISRQPQMFNFIFHHRTKKEILGYLVDTATGSLSDRAMVTIDSAFGPEHLFTGVVMPVLLDENRSSLYCWNLSQPASDLKDNPTLDELDCSAVAMSDLGIIKIKLGACPILVPYTTLKKNNRHERVGIDMQTVADNIEYLRSVDLNKQYMVGCIDKFARHYESQNSKKADPEFGLYGYLSKSQETRRADQQLMNEIHRAEKTNPEILKDIRFSESDMNELLFRYRARNYENQLSRDERAIWNQRISDYSREHSSDFMTELNDLCIQNEKNPQMLELLKETAMYYGITGNEY